MKTPRNFLISYDIENIKNRTKLFEALKDLGLISVQKSVFYGQLIASEKRIVFALFKKYCSDGDKAILVPANIDAKECFGYSRDELEFKEFEVI